MAGFSSIPVAGPAIKKAKKPKTVNISLPGDPGYVAPGAKGDGTAMAPKIKIKSIDPNPAPILPAGTGIGGQGLAAASTAPPYNPRPVGDPNAPDRNPRNEPGSNNTGGISNPMSGFASRYDPTKLDPLYSDPNLILEDVLRQKGMATGSGMAEMGDYAKRMGSITDLLQLTQSGQNADAGNDEHWINTVAELLNNSMGPGGTQMDYSSILKLLLNPQQGGGLSEYLYGDSSAPLTVGQQDQMLNPMFLAGITGMSPAMQRAMANAYNGASTEASRSLPRGTNQNPQITQYLKDKLSGIIPGL